METDYLTFAEAKNFVDQCERQRTFIYGIERFICVNGGNIPDMDGIADFSSLTSDKVNQSITSARSFLSLFGKETEECFKLVCDSSHDYI